MAHTIRFSRRKLPHWEVENGRYFVTVRCADSLPREAILRIAELQRTLSSIEPRSLGFAALQRQIFRTLEKYLDAGRGACPLRDPAAAEFVIAALNSLDTTERIDVPHYTIMPNHWHALIVPAANCAVSLSQIMARVKGRTARAINAALGGAGPLWQREWFDRWIRDDAEWERCVAYIRSNPVKAGLATAWSQHPWTKWGRLQPAPFISRTIFDVRASAQLGRLKPALLRHRIAERRAAHFLPSNSSTSASAP